MGLFSWLRERRDTPTLTADAKLDDMLETHAEDDDMWEPLDFYAPVPHDEQLIPSIIASALAAETHPESQFVVKHVEVAQREAHIVACIATALAAGDAPDSQFVVRRMYRKKTA